MLRRLLLIGLIAAAAGCLVAPPVPVRADGDPASDVLLGESVFYPYTPPVSAQLQRTLNAETAAASRARFPIKVALIASPVDLGVIPGLFGKPQQYADFLDQEISFQRVQPLLVVMTAGYGVHGLGAQSKSIVAALPKPAGGESNDLAQAAIAAVAKLAKASGHPIAGRYGKSSSGSGGSSLIIAALAVAAALTALAVVIVRHRHKPAS